MEIDYEKYSLEQLCDVEQSIDQEKYPERYETVVRLIEERKSCESITEEDRNFIEESKGLDSEKGCIKSIEYGVYGGIFFACMTLLVGLFHFTKDNYDIGDIGYRAIDIGVILTLTYFVHRKSRIASTFLFAYFVVNVLYVWFVLGKFGGILVNGILLVVFFSSMLGTYYWNSKYKSE